jgi:tetratricopeptide (TPR) repeat protein
VLQTLKRAHSLQKQGRPKEAERLYREVLSAQGDNLIALNLLGALCVNSGRAQEAAGLIRRALRIKPNDSQALANLALAHRELGDVTAAIDCLEKSLSIKRNNPAALNSLANLLRESGDIRGALPLYREAVTQAPEYVEAWCNIAALFREQNDYPSAEEAARRALTLDQDKAEVHFQLAEICRLRSDFTAAVEHYELALKRRTDYSEAMLGLAHSYRESDRPEQAQAVLQRLLDLRDDNAEALSAMGVLQEQLGAADDAALYFQKAIAADSLRARSYYQLAAIKGRRVEDDELQAMESLRSNCDLADEDKAHLGFALGQAYEQRAEYERAFDSWAEANSINASRSPYNEEVTREFYASVVEYSQRAIAAMDPGGTCDDPTPVFIVGMPRSGTSLTGQILTSHSSVSSIGETSFAYDLAEQVRVLTGDSYPSGLERLGADQCRQLGESFRLRTTTELSSGMRVVDNTPLNYQHIGLLAMVLPQARFVHCHRDPVDTCFSMFKLPFADNQSFAHDLRTLGRHYLDFRLLMTRWHALFPGRIMDVCYEDTVADLELQARRLTEFLGLPFEKAMLEFHLQKNLVRTPSATQVRRPLYGSAVDAWQRYERQLQPLLDALSSDGVAG